MQNLKQSSGTSFLAVKDWQKSMCYLNYFVGGDRNLKIRTFCWCIDKLSPEQAGVFKSHHKFWLIESKFIKSSSTSDIKKFDLPLLKSFAIFLELLEYTVLWFIKVHCVEFVTAFRTINLVLLRTVYKGSIFQFRLIFSSREM